jgi:OOP family OmpA-OmpF porin
MTSRHVATLSVLAGLLPFIAAPAFAQDVGAYYLGLSGGQSRADFDERGIVSSVLPSGAGITSLSATPRDFAYRVFGGYQFHQNFAFEAGYFDLGRSSFYATTSPAGSLDASLRLRGVSADLVGRLPLTGSLSAIARVGAQYAVARENFSGTGVVGVSDTSPHDRSLNYKLGVGLQYQVNASLLVRGEAERYRMSDGVGNTGNVNVYSVSLVFPFGGSPSAVRTSSVPVGQSTMAPVAVSPRRSAPEPVAVSIPTPALAPMATPVPTLRPAALVISEPRTAPPTGGAADARPTAHFAFDRSAVGTEGRAALDGFTRALGEASFDVITVEGYADRIGTPAYNRALSLRRAESVKAYLVDTARIDPGKISAVGRGATGPVTRPSDCIGSEPSPELIECLNPDRRVEVAVRGVR